jgi:hypothetical protein
MFGFSFGTGGEKKEEEKKKENGLSAECAHFFVFCPCP